MSGGLVIMRPMKWIASLVLLAACGSGDDDVYNGTRGQCEFGGELNDCPDAARTSEGACWRLVDCGRLDLEIEDPMDPNRFDWGTCVDGLDSTTADRRRLAINCIAASTCDELRARDEDGFLDFCLELAQ
jgi:hypothetical protein